MNNNIYMNNNRSISDNIDIARWLLETVPCLYSPIYILRLEVETIDTKKLYIPYNSYLE